jgi:peroxiredoxin
MTKIARMLALSLLFFTSFTASVNAAGGLQTFDGKPDSIDAYIGNDKWLVVVFWAHNCHICDIEAESYAQFHDDNNAGNASVLGVSIDGLAGKNAARGFIDRHDLPFPNLIGDTMESTLQLYSDLVGSSFVGTPTVLLIDPQGELRAAQAGAVPPDAIEAYIARNTP